MYDNASKPHAFLALESLAALRKTSPETYPTNPLLIGTASQQLDPLSIPNVVLFVSPIRTSNVQL